MRSDDLTEPTRAELGLDQTAYIVDIRAQRGSREPELVRRYTVSGPTVEVVRQRLHDALDATVFSFEQLLDEQNARDIAAAVDARIRADEAK